MVYCFPVEHGDLLRPTIGFLEGRVPGLVGLEALYSVVNRSVAFALEAFALEAFCCLQFLVECDGIVATQILRQSEVPLAEPLAETLLLARALLLAGTLSVEVKRFGSVEAMRSVEVMRSVAAMFVADAAFLPDGLILLDRLLIQQPNRFPNRFPIDIPNHLPQARYLMVQLSMVR